MHDVIIVGGGPAGLNAALWLGRCRRDVLLVDAGRPRNARSRRVSGFLTRDGSDVWELRAEARRELAAYASVRCLEGEAVAAEATGEGFTVTLADGTSASGRKLILATGLGNDMPDIPDGAPFYGRGVYPCPYCDGWEHRDEPLLAFGRGSLGRGLAFELTAWSRDITLLTHGPSELSERDRRLLAERGIAVIEEPIETLEGEPDGAGLERVRLRDGRVLERRALFFTFDECRQSPLIAQLGCDLNDKGAVETGQCERTNVPGLFVVGDASKRVKFAVVAAAEGSMAAFAVNTELVTDVVKAELKRDRAA